MVVRQKYHHLQLIQHVSIWTWW